MNRPWQVMLTLVAVLAAVTAVGFALRASQADDAIDGLTREIAALRSEIEVQRTPLQPAPDADMATSPANAANEVSAPTSMSAIMLAQFESLTEAINADLEAVHAELAQLRTEVARAHEIPLAAQSAAAQLAFQQPFTPRRELTENEVAALENKLYARNATVFDKLEVLRELRDADARSDAVAAHMIAAYYETESDAARADIFRQLDGMTTAPLRTALLHAVANDDDPEVREEAAETLEHFLPDEEVRQWLSQLAEGDLDANVRRQARESLHGF